MDASTAIALARQVLVEALALVAPILGVSLVVGLIVALFQALTSVQEQTVAMVPKLMALAGSLFFLLPWMLRHLVDFAQQTLLSLARFGGRS